MLNIGTNRALYRQIDVLQFGLSTFMLSFTFILDIPPHVFTKPKVIRTRFGLKYNTLFLLTIGNLQYLTRYEPGCVRNTH